MQSQIEEKAAEHGITVEYMYVYVHPHHTSEMCHAC
ncbi:hypothetical protein [Haloquadratum walsbyi]|nr:hypothetical protein [Haloquadratum walsbyi]